MCQINILYQILILNDHIDYIETILYEWYSICLNVCIENNRNGESGGCIEETLAAYENINENERKYDQWLKISKKYNNENTNTII